MKMLRDVLSCIGVYQVWNPAEEADDVIATLVRGPLVGQSNLIVSSDKDFLQLVTDTTKLLYPAIGSRNEVLYDYAAVVEYMGVPPEKVVQLRALFGDESDNIPSVPRVPKKVLRQLIQSYGSVAGIYQTGLAELSKGQYERLMSAEPQVRINVDLMTLLDIDVHTQIPNVDVEELVAKLKDLDIDPTSHVATFFGRLVDE
jgi:DNA polymerase-1